MRRETKIDIIFGIALSISLCVLAYSIYILWVKWQVLPIELQQQKVREIEDIRQIYIEQAETQWPSN